MFSPSGSTRFVYILIFTPLRALFVSDIYGANFAPGVLSQSVLPLRVSMPCLLCVWKVGGREGKRKEMREVRRDGGKEERGVRRKARHILRYHTSPQHSKLKLLVPTQHLS